MKYVILICVSRFSGYWRAIFTQLNLLDLLLKPHVFNNPSQYILDNITNYRECVMVAKNPSSTRRVSSYAERLRVNFAVIHGELKEEVS